MARLALRSPIAYDQSDDSVADVLRAMCDQIETDLTGTMREVVHNSGEMMQNAMMAVAAVAEVDLRATEIAASAQSMNDSATAVAGAVEQLSSSARDIRGQTQTSTEVAEQANRAAGNASQQMQALRASIERIGAIVGLIESIAARTNLLALNASIEATRAGAAGRGFAVVAQEVKSLSGGTRKATEEIRKLIDELTASSQVSMGAVDQIVVINQRFLEQAQSVGRAVDEQGAAIDEIARSVAAAAVEAGGVSSKTAEIVERSQRTAAIGETLGRQTESTTRAIEDLSKRLVIAVRESNAGNRRAQDRLPTEEAGQLRTDSESRRIRTVDLSEGGALLHPPEDLPLAEDQRVTLALDGVGAIEARFCGQSSLGCHLAFERMDRSTRQRLVARLGEILAADRRFVDGAQQAARQVEAALGRLLESRRISLSELFDPRLEPIAETNPQQFRHRALEALEEVLPAIQEPMLGIDERIVFCATVLRSGYLPVHNNQYSHPQRPGELAWNLAHSRNRRIFDDRAGLRAARNCRPFLLQAYQRQMGGGELVLMKEADAPVFVNGEHWGNVRLAYKY